MSWNTTVQAHTRIEQLAVHENIQVILIKFWALSTKSERIIERYFERKQGRTIFNEKPVQAIFSQD